jgi:hypothetical protein
MIVTHQLPKDALTFRFNTKKPRRNQGKNEAIERWRNWNKELSKPMVPHKGNPKSKKDKSRNHYHSIHHLEGDRSNGDANNLFVCETEQQHENLELQLKQCQIELAQSGTLGFDLGSKNYFVAWEPLAGRLRAWRQTLDKQRT